jgi:Domain of Unknown Function (DUF1080)
MRTFYALLIVVGMTLFGEAQESKTKWRVLFDGTSLDAWRGYKTDKVPSGWRIDDGLLAKEGSVGDIVSKDEFGDFELELEWKIAEAGNSGIFYRGTEEYDHILERTGIPIARRHQSDRQQNAINVRRRGLRSLSLACRSLEACRRMEPNADHCKRCSR